MEVEWTRGNVSREAGQWRVIRKQEGLGVSCQSAWKTQCLLTYLRLTWGAGALAVASFCHRHTTECVYTVVPFTGPWSFHASFVIVDIVRAYIMLTFLFSRTIPGDQSLCCHRRQTGPKWATLAGQTYPKPGPAQIHIYLWLSGESVSQYVTFQN